uniref:tRNA wybutosine-synthesizing protein 2/3/4 n=1 Tax=Oryza brachyantha TaxID=4533 RepID=J3MLB2_ORYBR
MGFDRRKAAALAALASPAPDKSPKGGVDAPIAPLLDAINSHPDLFTTSSCSGRVSVLAQPPPAPQGEAKAKKKARGGGWVYVSHDPADPEALVELLFGGKEEGGGAGGGGDELVFRFEPMIVAGGGGGAGRDAAAAAALVSTAVAAGFRESGITSLVKRVMVALRCSIRMEVPLGQTEELVVSPDYIRYLVRIANSKMEANKKRMDGFLDLLQIKSSLEASYLESQDPVLQNGAKHGFGNAKRHVLISLSFYPVHISPHGVILTQKEGLPTLSGNTSHYLSTAALEITGEPVEKLFLWGQSACPLTVGREHHILTFGGFGGPGRHARRNYSLLLNHRSGLLTELKVTESPSPRMGHTVTVVGHDIYVVGGRGGPSEILNDVWVLESTKNIWSNVDCTGDLLRPRHRHAAAAVDHKLYVFGGLSDDGICSCMNIMDTESTQWNVISSDEKWPCARHSHSLVSYGSKLFMLGGHDGQRALNDFYSFDTTTLKWNKENTNGKAPSPRFSHCMFIYKDYLGILGGCPIRESSQEIALLNLKHKVWFYVSIPSLSQCLCVRSSSVIIYDDLVIVGGGASCYAFGTRFSQPIKIDLHLLEPIFKLAYSKDKEMAVEHDSVSTIDLEGHEENCIPSHNVKAVIDTAALVSAPLVLQLEKKYAKLSKDILKKFGWLDITRKARVSGDNIHVLFPVTKTFHTLIADKDIKIQPDDSCIFEEQLALSERKLVGANISLEKALEILVLCHGSILKDELAISRKASKTPQVIMRELVSSLLDRKGLPFELLEQLPTRWETLGDITVLPKTCFKDPLWESVREDLWPLVAKSLGAQRLARQGKIAPNGTRDSTLELLVGNNGWLTHHENGIYYSLDATKCMFSSGNRSEKLRMGKLDCRDEVVVDLFAGIGYFVLPFLVKANAKLVYACEWNPHALEALRRNVMDNHVADRCIILEGDNRMTAPKGIADRVCLGLLPSSECSWDTAVRALRAEGGMLHIHGNVNDSDETCWLDKAVESICNIAKTQGLSWNVTVEHVERVKWYGPHIRHLVVDVKCRPT